MVSQYDWNINIALAVMRAESGCNPNALGYNTNGTSDGGLFQINSIHTDLIPLGLRSNPELNIKAAYAIYSGRGWSAWSAFNSGRYKNYL